MAVPGEPQARAGLQQQRRGEGVRGRIAELIGGGQGGFGGVGLVEPR